MSDREIEDGGAGGAEDELLRSLAVHDVGPVRAEHIRALAHQELAKAARPNATVHLLRRVYRRAEPALVGAVAASYVFWTFSNVIP